LLRSPMSSPESGSPAIMNRSDASSQA
jgi:hypothetical protein